MDLIIGGAYQGKLDYAKTEYSLADSDIYTCTNDKDLDLSKRCIYHFEEYLLYCYRNGITPLLDFDEDKIVIMNDIFCGVVPIDTEIRGWREFCGRSVSALTKKADGVTRIFCGLSQRLK